MELEEIRGEELMEKAAPCHGDNSKYKVNKPYPPIKVAAKNEMYANILQRLYSGVVSEFSAVAQYINHETRLYEMDLGTSEVIKGIAGVEMKHMQILGELIVLLGANPFYGINCNHKKLYWTPKVITYGDNIKSMIEADILAEEEAILGYEEALQKIKDPYIVAIINRIIEDESLHLKLFRSLLKSQ